MFDLKYAGISLRKAAYLEGIREDRRNAWYRLVADNEDDVKAVVGDSGEDGKEIAGVDMDYAAGMSWREIKKHGRL